MVAATFAEAGEHDFARELAPKSGSTGRKKVLLSTDCPFVTGKIIDHALNLCKRLGAVLEVYQIIPPSLIQEPGKDQIEEGTKRLESLQQKLNRHGIEYQYAIKEASLEDELKQFSVNRRDIEAVIVPMCSESTAMVENFRSTIGNLFACPVIFFEA